MLGSSDGTLIVLLFNHGIVLAGIDVEGRMLLNRFHLIMAELCLLAWVNQPQLILILLLLAWNFLV
jgi:hypothetical protein